jgi:hypothetical protein
MMESMCLPNEKRLEQNILSFFSWEGGSSGFWPKTMEGISSTKDVNNSSTEIHYYIKS